MMVEIDESFEDDEIDESEDDDYFEICQCSVCHCFTKTTQGICADCRNGAHRG